jgi:anti-anti-sigma regulatory factor
MSEGLGARIDEHRVLISRVRGCLVASIREDLDASRLAAFRDDLLGAVRTFSARAVVLDLSGLALLDLHDFTALRRTIAMAELLGARAVLVGLSPPLIMALLAQGADVAGLVGERSLEDALDRALGGA